MDNMHQNKSLAIKIQKRNFCQSIHSVFLLASDRLQRNFRWSFKIVE